MSKIHFKASSHIDDTTRHDSMRHDPFFLFPIQLTGSVHTYAARPSQVVTTKAAATKIALEAIFLGCRCYNIMKTAIENSFHRNLTYVYKFMTRHDTTACHTTVQRTKARKYFSLVPHIRRHDHAT